MVVQYSGIPPGQQFTYVIPIDTADQWGSYWVHAHDSVSAVYLLPFYTLAHSLAARQGHYVDGLRAPFLIHPTKEVYSYDEEFTVILGDWYHAEHSVLLDKFINIANPGGAEPVPGLYFCISL